MIEDAFGQSPFNANFTTNIEEDVDDSAGSPAQFKYVDKGNLQDFSEEEFDNSAVPYKSK